MWVVKPGRHSPESMKLVVEGNFTLWEERNFHRRDAEALRIRGESGDSLSYYEIPIKKAMEYRF